MYSYLFRRGIIDNGSSARYWDFLFWIAQYRRLECLNEKMS